MDKTELYYQIDGNREIRLTIETRVFNGIDSDPKVLVREPSVGEVLALAEHFRETSLETVALRPYFDFPEVKP